MPGRFSSQITISEAIESYLESVLLSRSKNTWHTYRYAMEFFSQVLENRNLSPDSTPADEIREEAVEWLALALKGHTAATERLYLTAATTFFEYMAAKRFAEPNLPRVRQLIRQHARRPGQRLPQFPKQDIENIIEYAINLVNSPVESQEEHLINLRDRAFLVTLADTGLRVHEACRLRRGDIDWREQRARVVGKGDTEAIVRFSTRAVRAIRDYLGARQEADGASGLPLTSLPLFIRHDKGAGKKESDGKRRTIRKIRPITTATGRNIVRNRVSEALGGEAVGTITPHSFRHYFVTTVLQGSGGNLKLAQELARHRNIAVTQRYAHLSDDELDRGYHDIFE